jgi:hypothetical protein
MKKDLVKILEGKKVGRKPQKVVRKQAKVGRKILYLPKR